MIKTKRDSLEKFIRTQMEGPGACNNRFKYIDNDEAVLDVIDVINTTPGSVYSTAILFPQRIPANIESDNQTSFSEDKLDGSENGEYSEQGNERDDSNDELDEMVNRSDTDEEDLYSLSQRFPTTIGVSCCLDSTDQRIENDNLTITISGRYYTKISKENFIKVQVCIIEDYLQFKIFFKTYEHLIGSYFLLKENGVSLKQNIIKEFTEIKQLLLSINLSVCETVAKELNGEFDPLYLAIGSNYRYLKSYKEKLWGKLRLVKDGNYISEIEKSIIMERIRNVELYETFISYLEDAISMCNSKSFGFWISHNFSHKIDLSNLDLNTTNKKTILSPRKIKALSNVVSYKVDDNVQAALSVWLQVTKSNLEIDSAKRYLKVQIENTSTPFEEDNKHYFSIVTEKVNQRCFFGVEVKVESKLLCPYRSQSLDTDLSNDIDQLNYLYRSIKDYGIGHLCSVDWYIGEDTKWVKSEFIPSYETPDIEPIPRDKDANYIKEDGKLVPRPFLADTKVLEFKWLSTLSDVSDEDIISKLYNFVDTYGLWINDMKHKSDESDFAIHNIAQCEKDYTRMRSNIDLLLKGNISNIESFRLMNSAMFIQLWHSKNSTDKITNKEFYSKASDFLFGNFPATWRPFQLAFILLNLDGIVQRSDDINWNVRNELVDLVWFPTGGGKTEAYLGIIALTIINRRRTEQNYGGTTTIMRYTLRLLANQQFRRAMRVILALEQLRRWNNTILGKEPISIGLFVGDDSLPNKATKLLEECRKWNNITNNKRPESKIPLDRCPWCGELLEFQNKGTESNPNIIFQCKNIRCTFSDELPVMLCDEYIYSTPPTLLFGTVDKFAAIGHKVSTDDKKTNQDSRRLFGKGGLNNLPPALIIQDELHLLFGPLGSAVGLFESAIDQLCSYKKTLQNGQQLTVRPKIISSTATTRNTDLQILALYDRNVNIFPKNGTDYDDSFFAFYKREKIDGNVHYISKRKYIGILPTGRTQMTMQMRLIATMFVHRALFEREYANMLTDKEVEKAIDYYHSIIAYFNSLKEFGKTDAQFYTEFTKYTRRLFKRVLRYDNMLECLYGYDSSFKKSELTGRLTGSEVNGQLAEVEKRWSANSRLPHKENQQNVWLRSTTPPDLILATNMISVGLDVDRFNSIVMNSMPRNIAEYIQASSRVARNDLGLVITLHNPFQTRDLSHFERFREFHEKLYYYVEPISITPFSKKSVAKYLPLYLATMIRHYYPRLADSAALINDELVAKIRNDLSKYFKVRLDRTQQNLNEGLKDLLTNDLEQNIENFMTEALEQWQKLARKQQSDNYSLRYSGSDFLNRNSRNHIKYKDLFLSLDAYQDDESENLWAVPMSLRNVESEAVINIKEK